MVSTLAGIGIALRVAASVGAFIRSAARKNKRPIIGSILVALLGVPFAAASVSGLTAGPLDLFGRIPGLSIVAWLAATAILVVLCAIGGHFLASVMGEHKGQLTILSPALRQSGLNIRPTDWNISTFATT